MVNVNRKSIFMKSYETPQTLVLEVNIKKILCQSILEGDGTEKFNYSDRHYGDDDFTDYQ